MTDEEELESLAAELEALRSAVIDSSSLIYLTKTGLLDHVARTIDLFTVSQVVVETGYENLPVEIENLGPGLADYCVLRLSQKRRASLISEDRKMLLQAERLGLSYYNALIMLCMLLLRGVLSHTEFHERRSLLISTAHYSKRVLAYGDDLAFYILRTK